MTRSLLVGAQNSCSCRPFDNRYCPINIFLSDCICPINTFLSDQSESYYNQSSVSGLFLAMWRYIAGVSNPIKPEVEQKDYFKDYEEKITCLFVLQWKEGMIWLEDRDMGRTRTVCRKHDSKDSIFMTGCSSYKLHMHSFVKHEVWKSQKRLMEFKVSLNTPALRVRCC